MIVYIKEFFLTTSFFKYALLVVFLISSIPPLLAQGNLLVYPKRVVFEGRRSVKKLTLSNRGNEMAVYNISFIEYRMNKLYKYLKKLK